jgi:Kef-type K+ transport system membrane component KefB
MELLYVLLVLLVVTRACSELAVRLHQPALVGELMGGVLIGVAASAWLSEGSAIVELGSDETFQGVLDLSVFFLMLLAGVETRPSDLAKASKSGLPIAIAGMLVPLVLGFFLGWWWLPASQWKFPQSLFIGVALAVTAVPVAVKVLMDLGTLRSKVGQVVIAAAVIDDVLSLILLAMLTALIEVEEVLTLGAIAEILARVALFMSAAWFIGRFVLVRVGKLVRKLELEYAEFSLLVIFGLAMAVLAEVLEMHFLIGAFAAGVLFTRHVVGDPAYRKLVEQTEALTLGFLAPVFFASIGIHLNLGAVLGAPLFLLLLLLFATMGKVLGAGVAASLCGFDRRSSLAIGSAMNARGAVEIIIADIALRAGLFDHPDPAPPAVQYLFSAVVMMAIVTTLATPVALRRLLRGHVETAGR